MVTEQQNVTVPVSREEVTVEREPITDANRGAARSGPAISEEEHEVTLSAERPVVEKEAVPVERVRLGTETHTEHETVGGEVRKEQIEVDTDERPGRIVATAAGSGPGSSGAGVALARPPGMGRGRRGCGAG